MLHYILQTIAFQLFFLIIYDVFLKRDTFFNWNRAYLLVTVLLSVVLPFIKIESFKQVIPQQFIIMLPEVILGNLTQTESNFVLLNGIEQTSRFMFTWELFFVLGTTLAFVLFTYKLIKILFLIYKNPKHWKGDLRIVELINSNAAFSFFHYVFLGEYINDKDKDTILKHEAIHVKQNHSLDLLLFEILRILFWFNPLVYMYQNRIQTLHEYIADSKAIKSTDKSQYYQNLLTQVFETQNLSFINTFFKQSLIKKRIVMLTKTRSKQILKLKYALLIPIVFGMLLYTSSNAQEKTTDNQHEISDLTQYTFTIKKSIGVTPENDMQIARAVEFLKKNHEYLFWYDTNNVGDRTSSIHHQDEKPPKGFYKRNMKWTGTNSFVYTNYKTNLLEIENKLETQEVPFAVIENAPIYPGCETLLTNAERSKCMADSINKNIQKNFNTDLAGDLGLIGRQRINVIFKIDKNGNVTGIRSRAVHPRLEEEAMRVIRLLPKMIPGKHKGEAVIVPYSLPIIFQIQE